MKRANKFPARASILIITIASATCAGLAQQPQRVWTVPPVGTFWSMQVTNQPPLPFLPAFLAPQDTPVYMLSTDGIYLYDDRNIDYQALNQILQATASAAYPPLPWDGEYGGSDTNNYPPGPLGTSWGPTDLWLEIHLDQANTNYVDLILHGATNGGIYQWEARTSFDPPPPPWIPGEAIQNTEDTNTIYFAPVEMRTPMRFFRAVASQTVVAIDRDSYFPDATEPCSTNDAPGVGRFHFNISPPVDAELSLAFSIGGSAENGKDYTNISGTFVVPAQTQDAYLYIHPTNDTLLEFDETVIITLLQTNNYTPKAGHDSATMFLKDCITNVFSVVAEGLNAPIEIAYHPPTTSLILSVNYVTGISSNLLASTRTASSTAGRHYPESTRKLSSQFRR